MVLAITAQPTSRTQLPFDKGKIISSPESDVSAGVLALCQVLAIMLALHSSTSINSNAVHIYRPSQVAGAPHWWTQRRPVFDA